jgi:N-acetylmuramoyl-L-alanine amidase
MDKKNFSDIGYNFLVGGDGETYEGRGWDMQGAFAKEFNNRSLGIAFIGNALISNLETQFLLSSILAK